jgi:hypothetical protein
MTDMTTPRETVRTAFYEVLNTALGSSTEVVKYMPFEGAPQHSIVLQMVSGSNRRPGLSRRVSGTQSGLLERYRIQISVHNPYGRKEASEEADAVEQAIMAALDSMRTTYGVFNIQKLVDIDTGPTEELERIAHCLLDYECQIETQKADP